MIEKFLGMDCGPCFLVRVILSGIGFVFYRILVFILAGFRSDLDILAVDFWLEIAECLINEQLAKFIAYQTCRNIKFYFKN